jgi:hypothetical protein
LVSSHENERATESIAGHRKATLSVQEVLLEDSGSLLLLSSKTVSRIEVGLVSSWIDFRSPFDFTSSTSPLTQSEDTGTSMEPASCYMSLISY